MILLAAAGADPAALAGPPALPAAVLDAAEPAYTELWLAVQVNGVPSGEPALLLRRADGGLLARAQDLERWRLPPRGPAATTRDGERFYALDGFSGLSYRVDDARQLLDIDAAPGLFPPTRLSGQAREYRAAPPAAPGAFLNYDFSTQASGGHVRNGALLEAALFNGAGVGVGDFVVRDYGSDSRLLRLDTTWTQDRPAQLASLRLGDAITAPGSWGRSVRFGGVQWATNFATQPGFIPFPLPQVGGEAVVPSTVDLLVDNIRQMSREVPAGPFTITNLPVVSGSGVAEIVVSDMLGRQHSVALPYYVSPALLQVGLDEFSYEAGFIRNNFGVDSNDYGRFAAVATHRHGFSDAFTGEVHAEVLRSQQTLGAGATVLASALGTFDAALAASRSEAGGGALAEVGFQRQTSLLSFGAKLQLASPHFTQIGAIAGAPQPRRNIQAYVSLATHDFGSFGLSYSAQHYRDRDPVRILDASYRRSLGAFGYLTFSAARLSGNRSSTFYTLTLTRPLSNDTSASASVTRQDGTVQAVATVQRNLPPGDGYGYRVELDAGDRAGGDAALALQNGVGTYSFELAERQNRAAFRGSAAGSIVLFGGDLFFSRSIDEAFGVVQIPGFANVRVYADNQEVASTNARGNAFVPRLRPYQANPIRIEQADLPLDAEIDTLDLAATPALRSGVLVAFPVRRARGGIITIVLGDGSPIPPGAVAQVEGQEQPAPVGMNGEAYLAGLGASSRVRVSWRGQDCDLLVLYAPDDAPVPQLGTYTCKEIQP